MGFYRDFQNEIKIFFVLVALVILAGWFGVLSTLSFSRIVQQERQEQPVAQEQEGDHEVMPAEEVMEEEQADNGLAQYTNQQIGVAFEYPKEWFLYDTATWEEDNAIAPCETAGTIENTVIVSKKNLGRCVGVTEFNAWPGDMVVSFSETPWDDFPFVLEGENPGLTEVGGVSVAKYLFSETSSVNRKQAVRLYANAAGKGYIIEFTQDDLQGTYDPAFDEILASVQWLQ